MNNSNGSGIFAPSGICYKLSYNDDSTEVSAQIKASHAVQILSSGNVAISFGLTNGTTQASFPLNDGSQGEGVIVQGNWQTLLTIPQQCYNNNASGNMWVSIAGESGASGNVYISLGDFQ